MKVTHTFQKTTPGFTIVEMLLAVVIIVVLTTIGIMAYRSIQVDARDTRRSNTVTVISNALEAYHRENGEYPSEVTLANDQVGNTGSAIAALLKISSADDLKMPRMPAGATNPLIRNAWPTNDYILYNGENTNAACQSTLNAGCVQYDLVYQPEGSASLVTIQSINRLP